MHRLLDQDTSKHRQRPPTTANSQLHSASYSAALQSLASVLDYRLKLGQENRIYAASSRFFPQCILNKWCKEWNAGLDHPLFSRVMNISFLAGPTNMRSSAPESSTPGFFGVSSGVQQSSEEVAKGGGIIPHPKAYVAHTPARAEVFAAATIHGIDLSADTVSRQSVMEALENAYDTSFNDGQASNTPTDAPRISPSEERSAGMSIARRP
ncbi:hypothetical protein J1614_006737 [Plenodomus biglobosus]|nr:hypothetical protein J1614_006737 [Plenodomus biglobosus]